MQKIRKLKIDKEALREAAHETLLPLGIAVAITGALVLQVWLCRNMLWLALVLFVPEMAVGLFIDSYKWHKDTNDIFRKMRKK